MQAVWSIADEETTDRELDEDDADRHQIDALDDTHGEFVVVERCFPSVESGMSPSKPIIAHDDVMSILSSSYVDIVIVVRVSRRHAPRCL